MDSRFLYVNLPVVKFVGLRIPAEMKEKYYEEVKAPIFENEQTIQAWKDQDQYLLNNPDKNLRMLEIHPNGVSCPFIDKKIPIHNENNECIGIINHIKFLEVYRPNDLIKGKLLGSLLLSKPDDFFTEKECEIIFLKLQGMTSKAIARALHRSSRTIENIIQELYDKTGVNNAMDFAEFCEKRNLHRYLPHCFISPKRLSFSGSFQVGDDAC